MDTAKRQIALNIRKLYLFSDNMRITERITLKKPAREEAARALSPNDVAVLLALHARGSSQFTRSTQMDGLILYLESEMTGTGSVVDYRGIASRNKDNMYDKMPALNALGYEGDATEALKTFTSLKKRDLITDSWFPLSSEGIVFPSANGAAVLGAWIEMHGLEHLDQDAARLVEVHRKGEVAEIAIQ